MVNYQNSKIYKIVCDTTGLIYVGSTTEIRLAKRLAKHKCDYKRYLEGKQDKSMTSSKLFENNNCRIELIELYPCNTKDELLKKERFYIESLECVNKNIPGRTCKQWHKDNKDYVKKKRKEYRLKNKDKIATQKKESAERNKEHIQTYQKELRDYKRTWCGHPYHNESNNLLNIDLSIFE